MDIPFCVNAYSKFFESIKRAGVTLCITSQRQKAEDIIPIRPSRGFREFDAVISINHPKLLKSYEALVSFEREFASSIKELNSNIPFSLTTFNNFNKNYRFMPHFVL